MCVHASCYLFRQQILHKNEEQRLELKKKAADFKIRIKATGQKKISEAKNDLKNMLNYNYEKATTFDV